MDARLAEKRSSLSKEDLSPPGRPSGSWPRRPSHLFLVAAGEDHLGLASPAWAKAVSKLRGRRWAPVTMASSVCLRWYFFSGPSARRGNHPSRSRQGRTIFSFFPLPLACVTNSGQVSAAANLAQLRRPSSGPSGSTLRKRGQRQGMWDHYAGNGSSEGGGFILPLDPIFGENGLMGWQHRVSVFIRSPAPHSIGHERPCNAVAPPILTAIAVD